LSAAFVRGSAILSFDSAEVGGETDHEAISFSSPHEALERVSGSAEIEWAGLCHRLRRARRGIRRVLRFGPIERKTRHSRLRNPATADFCAYRAGNSTTVTPASGTVSTFARMERKTRHHRLKVPASVDFPASDRGCDPVTRRGGSHSPPQNPQEPLSILFEVNPPLSPSPPRNLSVHRGLRGERTRDPWRDAGKPWNRRGPTPCFVADYCSCAAAPMLTVSAGFGWPSGAASGRRRRRVGILTPLKFLFTIPSPRP
jgi:hypothetical protein